jgi:hypothetical protein
MDLPRLYTAAAAAVESASSCELLEGMYQEMLHRYRLVEHVGSLTLLQLLFLPLMLLLSAL